MQFSKEEALARLYNHVSSSFQHVFLLLFSLAIFLVTFFTFTGRFPLIQSDEQYECVISEDEEQEDNHCGRETLLFQKNDKKTHSSETLPGHNSQVSDFESEQEAELEGEGEFAARNAYSVANSVSLESRPTSPITLNIYKSDNKSQDEHVFLGTVKNKKVHSKKLVSEEKDDEEIDGDSCTDGSTSKGSSEWRGSIINCRDSGTEDHFTSSSRRSCPKWESYTMFQKYDEEMSFLDRISAHKLQETESLRSIQVSPRSISERFVHKFSTANKKPSDTCHNPYGELEGAYVAQICLTWEALNWNYKNFHSKHASRHDLDTGSCPATTAQQFQQFQILLHRYIENEPYEHGRRPEIYARMRLLAPKLLLVPEYKDLEEDQKDGGFQSKVSSASFLMIMEDGIRTFMNFLKADKEKPCQILAAYFRRNRRVTVDPTLLQLMKKVNQKKRMKVKDLQESGKCLRKRKMKVEEEMDTLMALIDLKVVSRVLRMNELNEQQLHWCEEKMSKVRVVGGKLQRDYSTPLFFPSHSFIH